MSICQCPFGAGSGNRTRVLWLETKRTTAVLYPHGRGDRIRTCDLIVPNDARYRTAPLPENFLISILTFYLENIQKSIDIDKENSGRNLSARIFLEPIIIGAFQSRRSNYNITLNICIARCEINII